MSKIIELPDGTEAEFPDEMDDAAISEVLRRQFPASGAPAQPLPDLQKEVNPSNIIGFVKGAAKSIPSTLLGAAEAISRGRVREVPGIEEFKQEYLEPQSTAEKAGQVAGQIGQFFTPAGLEGQAAGLAARVPFLGRVAPKLTQTALEAFPLSAAQSGSLEGGAGAAVGGAGVGSALRAAGSKMLPAAETAFLQAMRPRGRTDKALAEAAVRRMIEKGENPIAMTRRGLAEKIGGRVESAGESLEDAVAQIPPGTRVDVRPILSDFERMEQRAIVKGTNPPVIGDEQLAGAVRGQRAKIEELKESQPPLVRLYRGEGQAPPGQAFNQAFPTSQSRRGSWYTDSADEALGYGPDLKYVDLPPAEAARLRRGVLPGAEAPGGVGPTFSEYNLTQNFVDQAKALEASTPAIKDLVSAESLRSMRQILGKITARSPRGFAKTLDPNSVLNDVRRETYGSLARELGKKFPDIDVLNKEFSMWKTAQDTLARSMEGDVGLGGTGFIGTLGAMAGGLKGLLIYPALKSAMGSAGWHTVSAETKRRLARALSEGNTDAVENIVSSISAQLISKQAMDEENEQRRIERVFKRQQSEPIGAQ